MIPASTDLARAAELALARGGRLGRPLDLRTSTGSTNDDAKDGARAGAPHGAVWVAEEQTRGRGRQGRSWLSARGENLLFSVLLRIPCEPLRVPLLALVAGLAVRDAVARALGDESNVLIKWPNDVLVRRPAEVGGRPRKIAGILVESALAGSRVDHVVVGIGINVHARELPDEIATIATSAALERDARGARELPPLDRAGILADVLAGLDHDAEHVVHHGLGLVHARLVKHDALRGQEVESADGEVRGTGAGIDIDGRLVVRKAEGTEVRIGSGEVLLRHSP